MARQQVLDGRELALMVERRVDVIEEEIEGLKRDVDYGDTEECLWEEGRIEEIELDIRDIRKSIDALHLSVTELQEQGREILERLDVLEQP